MNSRALLAFWLVALGVLLCAFEAFRHVTGATVNRPLTEIGGLAILMGVVPLILMRMLARRRR